VLNLRSNRRQARIALNGQFLRCRLSFHSATAAVIADPIPAVLRDRIVIDIVNPGRVHIRHGSVVVQVSVIPIGAVVSAARVAIAVLDASVVADVRCPVSPMPAIVAIFKSPPGGRPKRSHIRRQHPGAWNPVIAGACVIPVTWRPNIIVARAGRLLIIGQWRRRLRGYDGWIGSVLIGIVFRGRIVCLAGFVGRSLGRGSRLGSGFGGSQVTISRIAGNICRRRLFLTGTKYKE
jgi:hypothetical protein